MSPNKKHKCLLTNLLHGLRRSSELTGTPFAHFFNRIREEELIAKGILLWLK
jgi:hypothetical protein